MSSKKQCEPSKWKYRTFNKNVNDVRDVGYNSLANAIVVQALIDYDVSVRRLINNDFTQNDYNKLTCKRYVEDVRKFLKSQYFNLLTQVDGEYLLNVVNHRIIRECGVNDYELPV